MLIEFAVKMNLELFFTLLLSYLTLMSSKVESLLCYSCVSSQPGCSNGGVNWFLHSAISCPKEDDVCVKITERRGGKLIVLDIVADIKIKIVLFLTISHLSFS